MSPPRDRSDAGFTLAELIVATTLISIVMAGVYTALNTAVQAWKHGESDFAIYDDARYALGLMSRELNSVPSVAQRWFIGSDDEIEFITLAPPMYVEDGSEARVMQVTYSLSGRDPREGKTLVREERIVTSALPTEADCEDEKVAPRLKLGRKRTFELASGVNEFELHYNWEPPKQYRDPNTPPFRVEMIETDRNKKCWGLPRSVRVHLALANPGDRASLREFEATVAFRRTTGGLPRALAENWWGGR